MKLRFVLLSLFMLTCLLGSSVSWAASDPMVKKHVGWNYGDKGEFLNGFIPALDETVVRPWELYKWKAIFEFDNGKKTEILNYDVFNVKREVGDPKFDKENGLGLVLKDNAALSELFDAIMADQQIKPVQKDYYREHFISRVSEFTMGHRYLYTVDDNQFLRISGIMPRLGGVFERTYKVSEDDRQAYFSMTKWPELKVTMGSRLNVNFSAYGVSDRNIRVVALPKGAFPDFSKLVSLTDNKLINTPLDEYKDTLLIDASKIVSKIGTEVDIVVDDGYGRTAIESVTLPDEPEKMDFVPTKLSLTEGGQLWVKFRYDGEDFSSHDYINSRGIPMNVAIKIGGAATAEFTIPSMYSSGITKNIKHGQEFNYLLGKIDVGKEPGKYYIKATATINNPNHQERALELPASSYMNNEISGSWLIENDAPTNDLIAQSITASPNSIVTGSKSSISAKVKNVGSTTQSGVLIRFYDNNKVIHEVRKTLPANEVVTVGPISWTGSDTGVHNISVHVDPEREKPDKNRSNNIATTGCSVTGSGGAGECRDSAVTNNWKVTYQLITGYRTKTRTVSFTDSDGKIRTRDESYTDYSDPIWETRTVNYEESLSVSAKVNTKQGIATNPKNPKDSDRESRGSWEIIPWASRQGLDPNEVTRAGYGFELKVTTNYKNDWETKVPEGLEGTAKPIGGVYTGPKPGEVVAKIYDSKGRYVDSITMERTSGGNSGQAVWEIPKNVHTYQDGKKVTERKYYTNKDWPDGNITVKIYVSAAGSQGKLQACETEKVVIYGSMYDDSQNIRQKK